MSGFLDFFGSDSTTSNTTNNAYTTNTFQPQIDASGQSGVVVSGADAVNITTNDPSYVLSLLDAADKQRISSDSTFHDALVFAGGAGGAITDIAGNAITSNNNLTTQALKFAAGIAQGYADETHAQFQDVLSYTSDAYSGILDNQSGLINTLGANLGGAVDRIAQQNLDALNFFGHETDQLQQATTSAITTVANKTQSENAQGLQDLQATLIKVAAIIVAGIVGYGLVKGARA